MSFHKTNHYIGAWYRSLSSSYLWDRNYTYTLTFLSCIRLFYSCPAFTALKLQYIIFPKYQTEYWSNKNRKSLIYMPSATITVKCLQLWKRQVRKGVMSKQLGLSSHGILYLKGITWVLDIKPSVLHRRYYSSHRQRCNRPGCDSKRLLINVRELRAESGSWWKRC